MNITYLSSGNSGHHSFVIDDQYDIYAMGEGSNYQLALDNEQVAKNKENYWPMKIHFFDNMQLKICRIACGKKFTIFISEGGATWSCGTNLFGALGWGDDITTLKQPKLIERLIKTKAKEAICGENHSVILDFNGRIWTFGINNQGQLGRKTANNLDHPKIVDIHSRKLSLGQSHTRIKKIET